MSILVVEDDRVNRDALVRLLQYSGHNVYSAATIADALKKLKASVQVVILDMELPDGSGEEILHRIGALGLPVKVAILSGSMPPAAPLVAIAKLDVSRIFIKPVRPDELLHWVAEATGSRRAPGGERDETPEPLP